MRSIKYFIVMVISFMMFTLGVDAIGVSMSSNYYSITKGGSVKVTATVSSESPIVSIEGSLMCKGAGANAGLDMEFDDVSNSLYSKSYSVTVKSSSAGTITCSVTGARLTNMASDGWNSIGDKSISITVKEPVYIPPKVYSSNNNLSSLGIEGYTINPGFSKDVKEYSLEVPNGTDKVVVTATREDNTSSVSGAGEVNVSEGNNRIEVKVTAENGNVNTYVINVLVKELNTIEVEIDNKKYTIIRKEGIIDAPLNYEKASIKIGDEDVLCYENMVTKNILIGLKDEEGNGKYYSYDQRSNKYTLYKGYKIGNTVLSILPIPGSEVPSGYTKVSFDYNEEKLEGYQYIEKNVTYAADDSVRGNDFYLVYAVNEMSGYKGLYVYDKLEGTVQRYDNSIVMKYQEKADNYFLYLLIALVVLAITIVSFMLVLIKKKSNKHKFV